MEFIFTGKINLGIKDTYVLHGMTFTSLMYQNILQGIGWYKRGYPVDKI